MISPRIFAASAKIATTAFLLASLAACSSRSPKRDDHAPPPGLVGAEGQMQGPSEIQGPQESFGPPMPGPVTIFGPLQRKSDTVVLVLGPGMGRAFAHAGAIRALSEAKIRIGAVLGTEMGALLGAIYAVDGNLNHFEWSLQKLKPEIFNANGGAILSKVFHERGSSERLERELRKILGSKEIQSAKIPLRISVQDARTLHVEVLDRGELVGAVRGAVARPGYFKSSRVSGAERVSANSVRPFLVREAKSLGLGPVIVIDAGGAASPEAAAELREADLVITPSMAELKPDDFSKRSEAAFQGKQAVNAKLAEIKKILAGAQQ